MTTINQKIPEGWSLSTLKNCVKIFGRIGYRGYTCADIVQENEGAISLSPSNIIDNKINYNDCTYISWGKYEESPEIKIQKNDIIFVKTGSSFGKSAIIKQLSTPATINPQLIIIKDFKGNIDYLAYLIASFSFQKKVHQTIVGGTIPTLSQEELYKYIILLPPLPEQEKIAEILGTWDLAIEKLTALIEQKKLLKKGLMQRLLNFKKEYLKRFDEIFEDYSDKKHSDKDLLSATQENGVIPRRLLKGRVMSPEGSLDGYKLVQSGSFVISLRSFQGGLEYSDYEGIISPAYTVLKDKISINKCFYRYFFKSYNFIEKYLSIAVIGIRDGKQISYPDLQSVKIPYPPLSEQKAIADILSKADEEIDLLTRKLSALKEQKTGLMQQLLTGKIRVKVA